MEPANINSESDSSWDLDDMCLDELINDEDDSLPNDCIGCLDELRSINSICSGDTDELLRNLPQKKAASIPESICLPAQLQHPAPPLHTSPTSKLPSFQQSNTSHSSASHAIPSHASLPPALPPNYRTVPKAQNIDLSHATSSHANPSHSATTTESTAKQPVKPKSVKPKRTKKGKKRIGGQPGPRKLKQPKLPVVPVFGLSGMIGNDNAFVAPATFLAFDNMLRESKTWSQEILFNEADVNDMGRTDAGTDCIVDICSKISNSCSEPYMFPIRFWGKESRNKLIVELKIAAIQSGGFNLHNRSSKSSKELENSIYGENIRLCCQSTRAYREMKDSKQKYCSSTRYVVIFIRLKNNNSNCTP